MKEGIIIAIIVRGSCTAPVYPAVIEVFRFCEYISKMDGYVFTFLPFPFGSLLPCIIPVSPVLRGMPITQCPISLKSPGNEPSNEENEADSAISRFLSSRCVHLQSDLNAACSPELLPELLLSSNISSLVPLLLCFSYSLGPTPPISPEEEERRPGEKMNNSSQSLSSTALPFCSQQVPNFFPIR